MIDDVISHATWIVYILQTKKYFCWDQQEMIDDIINQLLCSKRLPRVSFILIAWLEPVKQDDHHFHAEILVCKFHLGSRKTCVRMQRTLRHQIFNVKMFPRKFCSLEQIFIQNHQGVLELFRKKPPVEGGKERRRGTHPHKNSWSINKTLDARYATRVFKHFKSLFPCSCTHRCFVPLILYLV